MSKVLIIYTGGTIGMVRSPEGYVPDSEAFRKRLTDMEVLTSTEMPSWDLVQTPTLLDSSNMTVDDWNLIGGMIADRYGDYDGFVVLHGTDTMAYTASALSFMLENLNKPVILTGAQIPLCEIRSDGRDNLVTSLLIAGAGVVHEVAIYFGNKLLRGNRTLKYSADGLTAFVSPSYQHLASAGIRIKYNETAFLPRPTETFRFQRLEKVPVGVIKVFPGIQFDLFESMMTQSLRGVVIETFGSGNIPHSGTGLLPIIQKAYDNGTVMVVCSQCPQGTVSLGTYETSAPLVRAGAVSGRDMTTEAAVTKLYYLFSKGYDKTTLSELMGKDLRGEMRN